MDQWQTHYRWVLGTLLIFLFGFLALFPEGFLIQDEIGYYKQGLAFRQGQSLLGGAIPGEYPGGTGTLIALFLWLPGTSSFFWMSLSCVVLSVWLFATLLKKQQLSPLFAWILLMYPATLLASRTAMSEAPSLLLITFFLYLVLSTTHHSTSRLLLIGFVGGLTIWFRETNLLITGPVLLGLFWRQRTSGRWLLPLGGMLGVGIRLLSAWWQFGDPWFVKSRASYTFDWHHWWPNLPLYSAVLLVAVPAGLLALLRYRGFLRGALISVGLLVLFFFASYGYRGAESGWLAGTLLSSRFFVPVLPVLAWTLAHCAPLKRNVQPSFNATLPALLLMLYVCVAHFFLHQRSQQMAAVAAYTKQMVPEEACVITTFKGAEKVFNPFYMDHEVVNIAQAIDSSVIDIWPFLCKELHIVELIRTESPYWKAQDQQAKKQLQAFGKQYTIKPPQKKTIGPFQICIYPVKLD